MKSKSLLEILFFWFDANMKFWEGAMDDYLPRVFFHNSNANKSSTETAECHAKQPPTPLPDLPTEGYPIRK